MVLYGYPSHFWSTLLGLSEQGQGVQERIPQEKLSTEGLREGVCGWLSIRLDMELTTGKRLD